LQVDQESTLDLVEHPQNENGEPLPAPHLRCSSLMPWQRPRGVATGTHRKSGVIID
jgi:hypothetical protein